MRGNRVLRWFSVCFWMLIIFYLSHQPSGASSSLSGGITDWLILFLPVGNLDMEVLHFIVRKAAHFSAYFLLGVLVVHAMRKKETATSRSGWYALFICFLYAVSDEFHQLFVPGRSGEIRDVLLDTLGAMIGITSYYVIQYTIKRKS